MYRVACIHIYHGTCHLLLDQIVSPSVTLYLSHVTLSHCVTLQCHLSVVPIYACLKKRTFSEFLKTVSFAIVILVITYTVSYVYTVNAYTVIDYTVIDCTVIVYTVIAYTVSYVYTVNACTVNACTVNACTVIDCTVIVYIVSL